MAVPGGKGVAIVRASMVEGNIPLLLSKQEKLGLSELQVELITTPSDQVGIRIDAFDERHRRFRHDHLLDLLESLDEFAIMIPRRTEGSKVLGEKNRDGTKTPQEPPKHPGKKKHDTKTTNETAAVLSSKSSEIPRKGLCKRDHEQGTSSQVEGRLCHRDCREVRSAGRGLGQTHRRQTQIKEGSSSSTQGGKDIANRLEESQSRHSSRAVRGVGGAGSQPKHRGPSLARVEEEPVSSGDRDLDAGSRGGAREECTRGGTSDTIVPDMSNPNDEANKWLDRPGFLRMFEVPGMQKDPQSDLCWPTHGSLSEGLGCKESSEEGDTDRDGDGSRIWQEGIQTSSEASNLNRFVEPGRRDESRCGLDMEPKFNMNITKEEMALIMQQRESTAVKHPVPEK